MGQDARQSRRQSARGQQSRAVAMLRVSASARCRSYARNPCRLGRNTSRARSWPSPRGPTRGLPHKVGSACTGRRLKEGWVRRSSWCRRLQEPRRTSACSQICSPTAGNPGAAWVMRRTIGPILNSAGTSTMCLEQTEIALGPSSKRLLGQLPGRGWVRLPCTSANPV